MNEPLLEIEHADRLLVVAGEVDAHTAPRLHEAGMACLDADPTLTLDLRGVGFMDSSGLSTLVALTAEARSRGGDLIVAAPSGAVSRVLEVSGLLGHITTRPAD